MENKIEIGEYIRLKDYGIRKITDIQNLEFVDDYEYYIYELDKDYTDDYGENNNTIDSEKLKLQIIKHSKEIIDLLEVRRCY